MDPRPNFTSTLRHNIAVVFDHSRQVGGESVRENPRAVVANCLFQHGNRRIIFRDPDGIWGELLHNGDRFLEVAPLAADELEKLAEACGLNVD